MTMSSLSSDFIDVGKHYYGRYYPITRVTVHHMAGVMDAAGCACMHRDSGVQASANYYIGYDGDIVCGVAEEDAPWTSSDWDNDNRAITIECSNSYAGGDWPISDATWQSMKALVADICSRYGIEPYYDGNPWSAFTEHRMFAATACPGDYIHDRQQQIVNEVKAAMAGEGTWKKGVTPGNTGKWWYEHADGSYTKSDWEKINGKWYCFDQDGWMVTGWIDWEGNRYYCRPKYGDMLADCAQKIDGKVYAFDEHGAMRHDCFRQSAKTGNWYCYTHDGSRMTDLSKLSVNKKNGVITIK